VAHINGSHDEDHENVDGEELREEIEATANGDSDREQSDPEVTPVEDLESEPEQEPQPPEQSDENTVQMTEDEFDEAIRAVEEEVMREGYQAAQKEFETDANDTPSEQSSNGERSGANAFDGEHCPLCGTVLFRPGEGSEFILRERKGLLKLKHKRVILEAEDLVCGQCDVVIEPNGDMHAGSEYDPPAKVH
jgi:hypothetical protein